MILRIATPYRKYLKQFYRTNPKVDKYEVMYKRLMDNKFLENWGDYSIIANDIYMQFAWALENKQVAWGKRLILRQIKHYNPDTVLIQAPARYNGKFINKIRAIGIKKVIAVICSCLPEDFETKFKPFDCVITCNKDYYNELKNGGITTKIISHSFDESNLSNAA